MFFYRVGLAALACCCLGLTGVRADEAEMKEIASRAARIAPALESGVSTVGNLADRERWDRLAATASGKKIVEAAEATLGQKLPDLPEELYKEYYRNGNRTNYQRENMRLTRRISNLALAEALENKGRFLDALDDSLRYLCAQPSWVLPAHDRNAEVYDGKAIYSDLGSTLTGAEAALAVNLFREKLSAATVELVRSEVERRVLAPYEKAVAEKPISGMWWVRTENNWSAVCHAGTVAAALALVDSRERRAQFVAAAEFFSETRFMKGFTNDGYCSEGMGYWNYGFGNYIYLGALVRNASDDAVDFFRFAKISAVLNFGPTMEIDKNNFAVFADCPMTARPSALYVGYLSRLKGFGYVAAERSGLDENFELGDLMQTLSIGFDKKNVFPNETAEGENPSLPIRTEFADAGVVICRPNPNATGRYFALALKGGHNGEMHNHNDVGSYSLILGSNASQTPADVYVSRDPGGETYTARTFSSRRYEGELLNSFGHPVPRIAGTLQKTGREARGVVVEKAFSDELDRVEIDATSAYAVPTLKSVRRTFEFRRAVGDNPGSVVIRDAVVFADGEKGAFETALITFEKIEVASQTDTKLVFAIGDAQIEVVATDADGAALPIRFKTQIVGEKDASVPQKPTRLALFVDGDVSQTTISQTFTTK